MVAVDYQQGFEALLAATDPLTRYAAFLHARLARPRPGPGVELPTELDQLMAREATRLEVANPDAWAAGDRLLDAASQGERAGVAGA